MPFHYATPYVMIFEHHVRSTGLPRHVPPLCLEKAARYLEKAPDSVNLITLHLGNGASAAAVKGGVSIDTSMGLLRLKAS